MTRLLPALVFVSSMAAFAGPDDGDLVWVVVRGDGGVSMHGDTRDLKAARKYFAEFGPDYLWFRREGKAYVVRDGKVIEQIEEARRPQEELGSEQARLGQRQSDLGRQQSQLGRQQSELGQKQARRARADARRQLDGEKPGADDDDQRDLAKLQQYLSRMQEKLGREQAKLGREQAKMGHQQQALSRELERKIEETIVASLKNGLAKPVD
jgi:hypothetical protein